MNASTPAPAGKTSNEWRAACRSVAVLVAWTATAAMLAAIAARVVLHDYWLPLVWINSFTFYFYLPAYLILGAALCLRRRKLAVAAIIVVAFHLWWVGPDWQPASPVPNWAKAARPLRVVSANLMKFNPHVDALCDELIETDADVLVVVELRLPDLQRLEAKGLRRRFPYDVAVPSSGASGLGVFSRYPLVNASITRLDQLPIIAAQVNRPEGAVRIVTVHPHPPRTRASFADWNRYWEIVYKQLADEKGPTILIGDFNMTQHAVWYERLLGLHLRDALPEHGRGTDTTWPNGQRWLPGIRIDHVLISPRVFCLSARTGEGAGSDHRPIIADLAVKPAE